MSRPRLQSLRRGIDTPTTRSGAPSPLFQGWSQTMTRKTLTLIVMSMLGGAVLSGNALAKDDGMFKQMDANGVGKISTAEHATGAIKMFAGMDTNKDGFVTAAEMDAYSAAMWKDKGDKMGKDAKDAKMAGHMKSSADKNGNVTQAEMDAGMKMKMQDHAAMDHADHMDQASKPAAPADAAKPTDGTK